MIPNESTGCISDVVYMFENIGGSSWTGLRINSAINAESLLPLAHIGNHWQHLFQ